MNLCLAGETVVVVGTAQGIGRAIAEAFAAEQADVALLDIAPEVQTVASELREKYEVRTIAMQVDVTKYQAILEAADRIREEIGDCRHMVYAAVDIGLYRDPVRNRRRQADA